MNSSSIRRRLCVLAATGAVMGIGAPAAGAATFLPASHDYGNVTVGSTSGPQGFAVTNGCQVPFIAGCLVPEFTSVSPISTTGDFAVADENCPEFPFPFLTTVGAACTTNVTFTPTAAGPRSGTVQVGALPPATLTGTGVVPASPAAGGTQGTVAGKAKKCKKKKNRSATVAKKKCKKGKKK